MNIDVERISRDLENGDDYSDVNRRHNAENEAKDGYSSHWLIDETGSVIALAWCYGGGSGKNPWHLVNVHSRPGLGRGVESHHPTLQSAWIEARAAAFCAGPNLWDEYVPQPGDGKSHWSRLADASSRLRCVVTPDGVSLLSQAARLGGSYSRELDRLHA